MERAARRPPFTASSATELPLLGTYTRTQPTRTHSAHAADLGSRQVRPMLKVVLQNPRS